MWELFGWFYGRFLNNIIDNFAAWGVLGEGQNKYDFMNAFIRGVMEVGVWYERCWCLEGMFLVWEKREGGEGVIVEFW